MAGNTKSNSEIIRDQIKVLSIAEGFYQSSILFALFKLDVFERIGEQSKSAATLAEELDIQPDSLVRLLNAGVMVGLLETDQKRTYRLSDACKTVLLSSAGEHYLGNWLNLLSEFYQAHEQLSEAVRLSKPVVKPSTYHGDDRERTRQYTLAMHNYASLRGKQLAHYLDTSTCRDILDLGCGSGTFAFHLGLKNPKLRLHLLDFPGVLEAAKEVQQRYPLENEVVYLPQDAAKDEITGSYDLILASNMLHCFTEETTLALLRRLRDALNPGGSLVVQSQYLKDDKLGGRWPIMVDLNLLLTTEEGRNVSVEETRAWLQKTGFVDIEYCPMSIYDANSFVRGYKPA